MRNINTYKGKEIDTAIINRIKEITASRCSKPIYDSGFGNIENVEQLAYIHEINVEEEILVLGEDWFLCYTVEEDLVTILEWVALDTRSSSISQFIEMNTAFKHILLEYKYKSFFAAMRHGTSYQFYLQMLKKGYLDQLYHAYDVDICYGFAPEAIRFLDNDFATIDKFLSSEEVKSHPEYLSYIINWTIFDVTEKFVENYKTRSNK